MLKCGGVEDDFAAQVQRFVKSSVTFAVTVGLAFAGWFVVGGVGCHC